MAKITTILFGVVLIIYGVLAALSPLPLGVPLIVGGFLLIACVSPAARRGIRTMRGKWRWLDNLVTSIGKKAPRKMSGLKDLVAKTAPHRPHVDEN